MNIRGAYFSSSKREEKGSIDFFILDPERRVLYSRRKRSEGLFTFNTTRSGEYMFIFSNLKVKRDHIKFSYLVSTRQEPNAHNLRNRFKWP